ncbi:MAG: hypothetical protein ACMUIU_09925 [bacterium]
MNKVYEDNEVKDLGTMFQFRILCTLSAKEQENFINRLIEHHNLSAISMQVKKRSNDLLIKGINHKKFIRELKKPLSGLNINELENRALLLYSALTNPESFQLSKEEIEAIPDKILRLIDHARKQMKLHELSGRNDMSFDPEKSKRFFTGLLVCMRSYVKSNE